MPGLRQSGARENAAAVGQAARLSANRGERAFHVKHTRSARPQAGTALSGDGRNAPHAHVFALRTPATVHGPPLDRGGARKTRGWHMRAIAGPQPCKIATGAWRVFHVKHSRAVGAQPGPLGAGVGG